MAVCACLEPAALAVGVAGNGGGLYQAPLQASLDPQPSSREGNSYRKWTYYTGTTLVWCEFIGNSARGHSGTGGGFAAADGLSLAMRDTVFDSNYAQLFGGGLFLEPESSEVGFWSGSVFRNNSVGLGGGAQFGTLSGGEIDFSGFSAQFTSEHIQVMVQGGGNVTWNTSSTLMQCPNGFLIQDIYSGLYGANAASASAPGILGRVFVSTIGFTCVACPIATYTLGKGLSRGLPGVVENPTCWPCPYGGNCGSGRDVVSAAGFWGSVVTRAVSNKTVKQVEFMQCPEGYCCGGICVAIDGCRGNRYGRLCGHCLQGYGEVIGGSTCRHVSECDDGAWFWPLAAVGILVGAGLMLRNGEVWCPRRSKPQGKARLVSYFYQVRCTAVSAACGARVVA